MTFDEILAQVLELLQREKRLSYRALKVRFALDDDHLEALKEEKRHLTELGETDMVAADRLRVVERDIRYVEGRIERALPVDLSAQPHDEVAFGASVEVIDEEDRPHRFEIVGEDEADVAAGRISWASPLAQSLIGAEVGDTVIWKRPAGDLELEVVRISYPTD